MKGAIKIKQILHGFKDYYYLEENGNVINIHTNRYLKLDKYNYILMTNENKSKKITLKALYMLVYGKNFCYDTIPDLKGEIWREIEDTDHKYMISNFSRVKSLQGYNAIIMKQCTNEKGYKKVPIIQNGYSYNKFVHVLTALAFPEVCGIPKTIDSQVHHIKGKSNVATNLVWLTEKEHIAIHNKKGA